MKRKYKLIKNFIFFAEGTFISCRQIPLGTIIETTDSGNYSHIEKENHLWIELSKDVLESNPDYFQLISE